jgi:hypothetical protein
LIDLVCSPKILICPFPQVAVGVIKSVVKSAGGAGKVTKAAQKAGKK